MAKGDGGGGGARLLPLFGEQGYERRRRNEIL